MKKLFEENKNLFQLPEGFQFELIDEKHTDFVISCRNEPEILDLSISKTYLTKDNQKLFLDNYNNLDRIDLILTDTVSGNHVGIFTLKNISERPELGKVMGNSLYKGKGLAKTSTINIINFGFKVFNLVKIYALTRSDNLINISLNKKIGFQIEEKMLAKGQEWIIMSITSNNFYEK